MNNRNILLTGFAAVIVVIVAIFWWMITPSWTSLYPNALSNSAQQVVLQQLGVNGFDYKLDNKNIILVKSDDFRNIQSLLSEKGLPEEGAAGLEIFANSDYGLSDFAQNINYQRGMEEELSRTIKKIKGIKDARVHLTIKKDSLFEERKQKPKASVVVSPYDGQVLSHQSIKSIQEIVAASVANLEPANVVVITDVGMVLSAGDSAIDAIEGGQSLEDKYTNQVNELLGLILPKDSFKVSVNVLIEQKKKVTIEENYFPDMSTGKGFLVKKRSSETGGYEQSSIAQKTSNKTNDEEYVFSKERSEIVYPEKEIKKIAVGLVISKEVSTEKLKNIEALIFNSLGMSLDRGDTVTSYFAHPVNENSNPLSIEYEIKSEAKIGKTEDINNVDYLQSKTGYIFMLMILFMGSSIIFMVLYLISRKSNSKLMPDAELNRLANDLSAWANRRD